MQFALSGGRTVSHPWSPTVSRVCHVVAADSYSIVFWYSLLIRPAGSPVVTDVTCTSARLEMTILCLRR